MIDGCANTQIWANQLSKKFKATTVHNVAKTGANNSWIFLETMSELVKNNYDLVLVQWSAIPRYKVNVGLELYTVDSLMNQEVNIVGKETVSKKWLEDLKNRLLRIHNDHWDLLNLVKYVNVLIELQIKARQSKIFFINGLGPWSDQYFVKKQINLPSDLDKYTSNLIQVDLRDDAEIFEMYNMIHEHYKIYGGIQQNYWLNLYHSMSQMKIDTIHAGDPHPGLASQDMFVEYFYQQLKQKLNHLDK